MNRAQKMVLLMGRNFAANIVPVVGPTELSPNVTLDVDTGWTKGTGWTIPGTGVASHAVSGGNDALSKASTLTVGQWYRFSWDVVARTGGGFWAGVGQPSGQIRNAVGSYIDIGRTTSTTLAFYANTTGVGSIDNLSCKQITYASCFKTQRRTASGNVIAEAAVTCLAGTQIGVAVNMDSATNPQNLLTAYIDGTKAYLDERVAGAAANLRNGAITYAAGAKIRVEVSGNTAKLYYNGVQVGADVDITGKAYLGNTLHMQFSTYEGNAFGSFSVLPN